MKKVLLAAVASAVLVSLLPASAGATTFDGSCKLKATAHFSPAINALPQQIKYSVTNGGAADGFSIEGQTGISPWDSSNCTGKLDGQAYDGPVALAVSGAGLLACDVGNLDATGTLSFIGVKGHVKHPPSIGFKLSTPFVLRFPVFDLTGNDGGGAAGTTQFWTTKNPAGVTNCVANGSLTPTTPATTPADGVSSAMFQAIVEGEPGGISG